MFVYVKWNSFELRFAASNLAIKTCGASPWPVPERRSATP
jgi:hypothetical protein